MPTTSHTSRLPPEEWLRDLLRLFPSPGLSPECFKVIRAADVPPAYAKLLVHEHHMTVTLESFHAAPVALEVQAVHQLGLEYSRKLRLRAGEQGPVVLAGIMRFSLSVTSEAVREEILAATTPLGRVLIEHKVLRRIQTMHFVRVKITGDLAKSFEIEAPATTYGRLAIIFCDELPAVELLEIVAPLAPEE